MCCIVFLTVHCKNLRYFINENYGNYSSLFPEDFDWVFFLFLWLFFFSEKVYVFLSREHLSCVLLEFSELTVPFMQLSLHQEAVLHFQFVYQHGLNLPFIIFSIHPLYSTTILCSCNFTGYFLFFLLKLQYSGFQFWQGEWEGRVCSKIYLLSFSVQQGVQKRYLGQEN